MIENMGYSVIDLSGQNFVPSSGSGFAITAEDFNKMTGTKAILLTNFKISSVARLPVYLSFRKETSGSTYKYIATLDTILTSSKLTVREIWVEPGDNGTGAVYVQDVEKTF